MDHHEGQPCPVARNGHAAVCLDYGGDHPQLLVTGGKGAGNKVLNDAWMLDVQSGKWREVRVYACRLDGVVCSAIPLDEMHWCHNVHGCMLFECEGMKEWMSTMLVYLQVNVPSLQSRCYHSAAAFSPSAGLTEVTIFGGCPECPSNYKSAADLQQMANTTVLRFGESTSCV